MTLEEVAGAVAATRIVGDWRGRIEGFSIDSRTVEPGDLFFAIRGPRVDGHDFVGDAVARGARGAVVADPDRGPETAPRIVVADTLDALQALASHVRRASGARVVAVTGSAGKTTTKEITARLLLARYEVFRSAGNLNNEYGLPLSLLELRHRPDVAVVELGMNHAGEISRLVAIAEPDVRVWTNVSEAHLGHFSSVDAIADAKAEVLEGARPRDVLVANAGDPRVMARAEAFEGRLLTFGIDVDADVAATGVRDLGLDGMAATVRTPAGDAGIVVPLIGSGNLANALAAVAVGGALDVPLDAMVDALRSLVPAEHRGEIVRLPGDIVVIDDAYNSNPAALAAALGVIGGVEGRRRVAVLGEMLELGDRAAELHAEAGRRAARAGLGRLVTVGAAPARALGEAAIEAGLGRDAVSHVADAEAAAALLETEVRPGDVVLVKGSHGVRTEIVVARLREVLG